MPSIKAINASLDNHTVVVQDLNNWLIYHDDNGQLAGWIAQTKLKDFEACLLRTRHGNDFKIYKGLESYRKAVYLVIRGL